MTDDACAHASHFHSLHRSDLLMLPNAWDAATARLVESLGARAIATTSGGVAWSHGYPDGDRLPRSRLIATVAAIRRVVRVPVSVDIEGGYGADPHDVGETVAAVIDAGAVGINLEDGTDTPQRLCAKIEHARRAATRCGVELFINARTDVALRGLAPSGHVAEILARAAMYRDAGADGLFVPGLKAHADIAAVAGSTLPLNLMAVPGLPTPLELETLGVRRLSTGTFLAEAMLGRVAALAARFLEDGVLDGEPSMPYGEVNALLDTAAGPAG